MSLFLWSSGYDGWVIHKLSNFPDVQVIAWISESGQALPRSGDLQGIVPSVAVGGTEPVQIIIDEKVP